jgi:hypothetical protein
MQLPSEVMIASGLIARSPDRWCVVLPFCARQSSAVAPYCNRPLHKAAIHFSMVLCCKGSMFSVGFWRHVHVVAACHSKKQGG